MAFTAGQTWQVAQEVEKQLHARLGEKDPTFEEIDRLLTQYRSVCENLLLSDFEFATRKSLEARLWDAHSKINNRFRLKLARFQSNDGKKRVVERRKLVKHYLDFIKSSQRFYRTYIRSLSSRFGGIPELADVAHKFKPDEGDESKQIECEPILRQPILISCYQTLVRLGDLSRYRETELTSKDRNWGPAIGYYDLACAIHPRSGAAHNQLAVIALADGNHLRATYHLYRALAVDEPHPTAKGNLEIEFKKIIAAWRKGDLIAKGSTRESNAGGALSAWFVLLHARCYKGEEFAEHDELENEVLSRLTVDLKERPLHNTLFRFNLVNLAAQFFAGVRLQENPEANENYQSFFFFLRLNIKSLVALLQILQLELDRLGTGDADGLEVGVGKGVAKDKLTVVARRVLPGLRSYSSWLTVNSALLVAQVGDEGLNVEIKEMWKTYANSLTLLAANFPAADLPSLDYLFEEDEETLGFKPFEGEGIRRKYHTEQGQRKPKCHDAGVHREDSDTEMLARVRDLLTDGLELVVNGSIPIALVDGGVFVYQEEGLPSELLASPKRPKGEDGDVNRMKAEEDVQKDHAVNGYEAPSLPVDGNSALNDDTASQSIQESEPVSVSESPMMNQMVDSIVGRDEPTSNDEQMMSMMPPRAMDNVTKPLWTGDETSYGEFGTVTVGELVNKVENYSQNRGSPATPRPTSSSMMLPSIINSAFAPQATDMSLSWSLSSSISRITTTRPGTAKQAQPPTQTAVEPMSSHRHRHQRTSSSILIHDSSNDINGNGSSSWPTPPIGRGSNRQPAPAAAASRRHNYSANGQYAEIGNNDAGNVESSTIYGNNSEYQAMLALASTEVWSPLVSGRERNTAEGVGMRGCNMAKTATPPPGGQGSSTRTTTSTTTTT